MLCLCDHIQCPRTSCGAATATATLLQSHRGGSCAWKMRALLTATQPDAAEPGLRLAVWGPWLRGARLARERSQSSGRPSLPRLSTGAGRRPAGAWGHGHPTPTQPGDSAGWADTAHPRFSPPEQTDRANTSQLSSRSLSRSQVIRVFIFANWTDRQTRHPQKETQWWKLVVFHSDICFYLYSYSALELWSRNCPVWASPSQPQRGSSP